MVCPRPGRGFLAPVWTCNVDGLIAPGSPLPQPPGYRRRGRRRCRIAVAEDGAGGGSLIRACPGRRSGEYDRERTAWAADDPRFQPVEAPADDQRLDRLPRWQAHIGDTVDGRTGCAEWSIGRLGFSPAVLLFHVHAGKVVRILHACPPFRLPGKLPAAVDGCTGRSSPRESR